MNNNEKKAREIAKKTYTFWRDDEGEDISSQDDCYLAAIQMATIKDGEFKNQEQSLLWTFYSILDGLVVEGEAREHAINEFKEHLKYYKDE